MAVRPVRIYGDPVLRKKAREITGVDDTVRALIADMRETMHAYNGVGLAANQVGVLQRVLVVDVPVDDEKRERHALINPVIDRRTGSEIGEEGCLSIPGVYDDVKRAKSVRVRALDERGAPVEITAEGYLARALQHEVDHLDGVLFVDRLSLLKRQFLRHRLDALARGERPDAAAPPAASGGTI
ncbi:MAG: peptide deformylase [Candidatus Eisenbacteria bacterium]|uniref:Peptide deformylase n=1 Tax=Eiseniibacteriota bacterium TaxID=2212470 RepID=A0A9D6LB77_UNCEI|nr:peptide deformylase [Candidatus Eisenbacteria bacterium]MBI3540227.1 peptide deformylase [Candidatus Eisenbacteria bacterium]